MKNTLTCAGMSILFAVAAVAAPTGTPVRVTGNNVNLRAAAELNAEVVGQAQRGDTLTAKSLTTEWAEIVPPVSVDFWAHRDFLEEGEVVAPRLNIRAGPGINYNVVATVERGTRLTPRGDFGEWIKVEPPEGASLWISREYVDVIEPVRPKPTPPPVVKSAPPIVTPRPVPPPQPVARQPRPKPAPPPEDLDLIPLAGQGVKSEQEGILRTAGFIFGRPSRYRLTRDVGHTVETICYVKGNEAQLQTLLGRRLVISGHEYWVQGVRYPVLVPDQIVLKSPRL